MSERIEVRGELSLDGTGWDRTVRQGEESVEHLAHEGLGDLKAAAAEAFAVGTIIEMGKKAIEFGTQIENAAKRLNVSTKSAQEFSFAASQMGSDLGVVESALDRLAKGLESAQDGSKAGEKMLESFNRLGISLADLQAKTPEELLRKIGERLSETGTNARTTADMMEIFGRGAGQLIPVLSGLKEKSEELNNSHLVFSETGLEELHRGHEIIDKITLALKELAGGVTAGAVALATGELGKQLEVLADTPQKLKEQHDNGVITAMEKTLALRKAQHDQEKAYAKSLAGGDAAAPLTKKQEEEKAAEAKSRSEKAVSLAEDSSKREEALRQSHLTIEQKITENLQNQRELRTAMARLKGDGHEGSLPFEDARNQLARAKEDFQKLNADKSKDADKGKARDGFKLKAGDSLTQTGNFLGASSTSIVSIGERTNQLLGQAVSHLATIAGRGNQNGNVNGSALGPTTGFAGS